MRIRAPIVSTAVAMLAGLAVLFLRLFPSGFESVAARLLHAAAALAAVALLIGIVNLLNVHLAKMADGGMDAAHSAILVIALGLTFVTTIGLGPNGAVGGVQPTNWLFQYIQIPVEGSLMALLAVTLVYAAARLLRRAPNPFSFIFLGTALLILLGGSMLASGSFGFISEAVTGVRDWITQVPAAAGARGLLLGIALGAVAAGLRILMGADRPFGG